MINNYEYGNYECLQTLGILPHFDTKNCHPEYQKRISIHFDFIKTLNELFDVSKGDNFSLNVTKLDIGYIRSVTERKRILMIESRY